MKKCTSFVLQISFNVFDTLFHEKWKNIKVVLVLDQTKRRLRSRTTQERQRQKQESAKNPKGESKKKG